MKSKIQLTSLLLAMALSYATNAVAAPEPSYKLEILTEGLNFPWCVAFLPNGDFLVTERGGTLHRLDSAGVKQTEITGVPTPHVLSQGGLFDVLPDLDFANNNRVYVTLAGGPPEANNTEIYSATLTPTELTDIKLLHRVTPNKNTPAHYGGRLIQLPDTTLMVTTGDGFDFREQAQNPASQLGKVLRFTTSGEPAADNPKFSARFAGAEVPADPYVYSFGHRNPQGLAADPVSGLIYATEHGPKGGDELNQITPAANYGWPKVTYGMDYSGAYVSPFTKTEGVTEPLVHWTPSIASSSLTIYRGNKFPQWNGHAFSSGLVEKSVRRVDLTSAERPQQILFTELNERIRDVRTGPDGYLYLLTDSEQGQLVRVLPK